MDEEDMSNELAKKNKKYIIFGADLFLYHGGVGDYTDNLALQLQLKGKLEYVITPHGKNGSPHYTVRKFKIPLSRKESKLDRLRPASKLRTFFYYLSLYRNSSLEWKKLKIDPADTIILFTDYYLESMDIIIHLARKMKIAYGIVFHGLDLILAGNKKFRHFKGNFSGADFLIFNSNATQALCRKLFRELPSPGSMIIHPGIDIERIVKAGLPESKKDLFRKDPGTMVFSTVSRLAHRKGIDIAIRIVHALAKRDYKVRYFIGGVGDEKDKLQALVRQLNAGDYITFMGSMEPNEKYSLLRESDFFLLPNHSAGNSDFEGFGISFIEASFFGNIIIGGNHGGSKEAVSDRQTGFLFDFDDPSSMDKAIAVIIECMENDRLMETIKTNGVHFVKENFDWSMLIGRFLEWEN